MPVNAARIDLQLEGLDAAGQLAWLCLLAAALPVSGRPGRVHVVRGELAPELRDWLADERIRRCLGAPELIESPASPDKDSGFVLISDARVLSGKLLSRRMRLYIRPRAAPGPVNAHLWQLLAGGRQLVRRAERVAELAAAPGALLLSWCRALRSRTPRVALISSVFAADAWLGPFLANSAGMALYADCEHFLVRPGSPGDEHRRLMAHAGEHPGAVYVNLPTDPGLYEVWNCCAGLATARYLSNANLDDRRAPEHLRVLAAALDDNPGVDVAGAALRISRTPNLSWEASGDCETLFAYAGDFIYDWTALWRIQRFRYASYNLPHCMPLWRRELHALNGFFRERFFGPSADWEFWLRVGRSGHRFYHHGSPLGLYLETESSYWYAGSAGTDYDQRIGLAYCTADDAGLALPAGLRFADAHQLFADGRYLEFIGHLMMRARYGKRGAAAYLRAAGEYYLGVRDAVTLAKRDFFQHRSRPASANDILRFVVACIRAAAETPQEDLPDSGARILDGALVELALLLDGVKPLVARAWLCRLRGQPDEEAALLQQAEAGGEPAYRNALAWVYQSDAPRQEPHKGGVGEPEA